MFQLLPKSFLKGGLSSSFLRFFASAPPPPKKTFGGLKDQDRIFTNLYGDNDPYIDGALKRVIIIKYPIFINK